MTAAPNRAGCRVCGSGRLEVFLDLGEQPHCNSLPAPDAAENEQRYPLRACFCADCATVQIDHTVPKERMFGDYPYVSGTTDSLRRHFEQSTDRLIDRLRLSPGDRVVDIGSNDGTWLECFSRRGLRALGIEPAANLARKANACGRDTMNAFFNAATAREILAKFGQPKLVTAAGVFFHLEELHSATEGVRFLVEDGGAFCVQAIYLGEMLRQNAFDNIYHEHLTYWTVDTIGRLLARFGLEIYRADLLPIHGGSLELLVGVAGAHPVHESVGRFIAAERARGLDRVETYHAFAGRVRRIGRQLVTILADYRRRGKTVHAFGAPAKGATLLNSFRIGRDLVSAAVERNPLKIGRLIPGAQIPILDEATAPPPEAYLVLPWNFLPEFLRKKKAYIENGGAFIVPIPEPFVIDAANYGRYAG